MPVSRPTVPTIVKPRFDEVVDLINAVCRAHLSDEYGGVARELTAALARKRPSPLMRGHCDTRACGVTHAVGVVNFLLDPTQQPHVRAGDLCALFGVGQSAGTAKSREILTDGH